MVILVQIPEYSLSVIDLIGLILGLVSAVLAFIGYAWYVNIDHQAEAADEGLRIDIREKNEFSGIRGAADIKHHVTSDTRVSRGISLIKDRIYPSQAPSKFVQLDEDTIEEAQIRMIRERVRDIPGRTILRSEFIGALRTHYMINLALSSDDVGRGAVEHFQESMEQYENAGMIQELSNPDHYEKICLLESESDDSRDPLNDVFLPLVEAAEKYCVGNAESVNNKREEIEKCRGILMMSFYTLWATQMKGVEVSPETESDETLTLYREDIRDNGNVGYWVLPEDHCDEDEFRHIRHMGWGVGDTIADYWDEEIYRKLHPRCDSIPDMEYVPTPFFIYHKNGNEFRGGASAGAG